MAGEEQAARVLGLRPWRGFLLEAMLAGSSQTTRETRENPMGCAKRVPGIVKREAVDAGWSVITLNRTD